MQDWLTPHGVQFPEKNCLKRELYAIIKSNKLTPKYAVDEMAKAARHEVVRLPPYHCELNPIEMAWSQVINPIEMAWSQVKRYIKENNDLFTLISSKGIDV